MARSHDRVQFTVRECYLNKENIRKALHESLSVPLHALESAARKQQDLTFKCRPSQFARFIIIRHVKYGEPNNMACLNMQLIPGEPESKICDVSDNPNRVWEAIK